MNKKKMIASEQKADASYSKRSDGVSLDFQNKARNVTELRGLLRGGLCDTIIDI